MKSVVKSTGFVLVHTPEMVLRNGTTQITERIVNPESEFLKELPKHLRSFEDTVSYWPNQVYIGNKTPRDLATLEFPWYDKHCDIAERRGPFGEIMPENEFILLMAACDVFELVELDPSFVAEHKDKLAAHPLIDESILARIPEGTSLESINDHIENSAAEALYFEGKLVGCVKRAHDVDHNFSAEIIHENLVEKASSVLAILNAVHNSGLDKSEIEYVIDCSEEACGDMNQRGGGNFAKAAAEIAGLVSATGSDTRGFCAAPTHALVNAAALVSSGVYKNVLVTAGGCSAKLGMNAKEHVKKGLPVLEDMIAGFAAVISEDDGISPAFDLKHLGKVAVGCGSAPQAVVQGLVYDALEKAGIGPKDVDFYAPELQNPDVTKPAGAGDVPLSNYKMIAALGVQRKELERAEIADFTEKHGLIGWAPTQGHIPSGVPVLGFACDEIKQGRAKRVMIIGKGSLFLGRMTNLFDGLSVMLCANEVVQEAAAPAAGAVKKEQIRELLSDALNEVADKLRELDKE